MVKKRGKHIPQLFDPFPRTPEGHLAGRSGADQVPIFFCLRWLCHVISILNS